jgi:hypothetical protein
MTTKTPDPALERPIPDAAAAVRAAAELASQMLRDLQNGWLWKLLTIIPKPPD